MSLNLPKVDVGVHANDGSGDPIRDAFVTVNDNFVAVATTINNGSIAVINNATYISTSSLSATAGNVQTLTAADATIQTLTATTAVADSLTANTITSSGNVNVSGYVNTRDIDVSGNLTVHGTTTTVSSVDTSVSDSLMHLHTANGAPWSSDDGKDIGFTFNYYKPATGARRAALVWANDTGALEYYSDGVETTANTFVGAYGNIKAGWFNAQGSITSAANITAVNRVTANNVVATSANITTVSTDTLTVSTPLSGRNVNGSLWLTGTDTVYVNGVPVTTSLSSFNGGAVNNLAWFLNGLKANSQVASTSTTTGALTVDGGAGITGNIHAGGIVNTPISGSTGDFTALSVSSTFAASSVSFLGGYISNVHGDATQWVVTDLTSGNVKITGGTVTGLSSLIASNVTLTTGTITGLTNLTTSAATITSGSLTGLSQVTTTNLTTTNGLVTNGAGARIAGDFSNATVTNRLILQTTTTNGATNISAMPRGTIAATALAGSFRVEDTNSIATGNGASGGIELYQDTDVRIQSTIRGTGTYLPLTIYTNGTKNAQFSTNHDFTVYNTSGTGVISLGANGVITATSFTGAVAGASVTGTVANATNATAVPWTGVTGRPTLVSAFTNDAGYLTTATAGGVGQIVAGTNITISPVGGTGVVTISTTATAAAANLTGTTLSSNVTASSLTSVGTLASLAVTGAITGASFTGPVTGNASTATALQTARAINGINFDGTAAITITASSVPGAKYTESSTAPTSPTAGDRWYNTASDILYQYIGTSWVDIFTAGITATSVATANAIVQRDGSAGAAFNALTATTLTVSATTGLAATGNGTQDIGTSANKFRTFYGVSTSAQYADLAEIYTSDKDYEPGSVVVFGGEKEVTLPNSAYDTRIAGVVSTNPAYLMNDSAVGLPIALTGRVPCKVIGPIKKGDLLVASKFPGIAQAIDNAKWVPGCVIGKALENVVETTIVTIEVVIGRF
jgi:hypothetical protein